MGDTYCPDPSNAILRAAPTPTGTTFVLALTAMTLLHFSWFGTPFGVGNDTNGTCRLDNVPAWWPHWLPS
ncbi:hypothetical protein AB0A69_33475 [Streptomyces sp. NPDC045431]|uniref:hypothetical protein n=1 Tax=Streptomyces sp. NPDC045431 TaxID=3155613 RepID=UPI0033CBBCA9